MELIKAIEKLNKLKNDAKNIEEWILEVEHGPGKTPVKGTNWRKVKKAIDDVLDDIHLEIQTVETKIQEVTIGIEVDV